MTTSRTIPSFGSTIRTARAHAGLSLRTLASMIGVSPTYLSQVERGEYKPCSLKRIKLISEALCLDADHLVILAGKSPGIVSECVLKHGTDFTQLCVLIHMLSNLDQLTEYAELLIQEA